MAREWEVRILGVRELTRRIAAVEPRLIAEMQATGRALGERIIARAAPKPTAVGAGRGAVPRPSASRNVLRIMAGGAHRAGAVPVRQWGLQVVPRQTPRPFLARAAAEEIPRIQAEWLDALLRLASRAGVSGILEIEG